MSPVIGIVGGSGLYGVDGLEGAEWRAVDTPWGAPSDALLHGTLDGTRMVFLPRHGRGHVHTPTTVPYRANVAAIKAAGVTHLVSISAVGSFREEMAPGHMVIVDQFVDRTVARAASFFDAGLVAHVSMAAPVCATLAQACARAARAAGATVHEGGTYLAMEGPQFSSMAESRLYRGWGCDVIGMTNLPEARLAREAELHYATVAMVTDYDSWHADHGAVAVSDVIATLRANVATAAALVAALPQEVGGGCGTGCATALDHAVMTAPEKRDPAMVERLSVIAGRVL
ncbi:S-methyl-5'-thioadenosine phosphorylase [Jannaschia seohaensis]|uniref:S-methyl-5'-thioadenosine phosphorylase n=1 Tax=Jannaschia seohaensis TaxID=475081 RepID=A0A2Y9A216_9RHOB|nr:S-methyl-5'-thioadenosine phosphorylase [Jannaschia seohaensis]PWJ22303.1 5'-methylthioadenosine phosphorylase [Jannaschia seohaensis]SSA38581.1 5'-methylthioadenosine phosphorylase [Jannaschia seohaensis]